MTDENAAKGEVKTALDRVREIAHGVLEKQEGCTFTTAMKLPGLRWDLCEEALEYLDTVPADASKQIAQLESRRIDAQRDAITTRHYLGQMTKQKEQWQDRAKKAEADFAAFEEEHETGAALEDMKRRRDELQLALEKEQTNPRRCFLEGWPTIDGEPKARECHVARTLREERDELKDKLSRSCGTFDPEASPDCCEHAITAVAEAEKERGDAIKERNHERELLKEAKTELHKADQAWQSAESRIVHICQLLGVDYTCEEPETCEKVIARLKANNAKLAARQAAMVEALTFYGSERAHWPGDPGRLSAVALDGGCLSRKALANIDPEADRILRIVKLAEKPFERFGCPYGRGLQKFDKELRCCQMCRDSEMCVAVRGEETEK